MTFARIDDNHAESLALVSDKAFRVHFRGRLFCARMMSDGKVPTRTAHEWGPRSAITELIGYGFWEVQGDHYYIPSHLGDGNWTRDRIEEKRRRDSERKNEGIDDDSAADSARIPSGSLGSGSSSGEVLVLGVQEPQPRYEVSFEAFWAACPRKQGKIAAEKAWKSAIRKAPPSTILDAMRRFAADPNRTEEFTPHPSTWLNQGRWEDEPLPARSNGSTSELDRWMEKARRG